MTKFIVQIVSKKVVQEKITRDYNTECERILFGKRTSPWFRPWNNVSTRIVFILSRAEAVKGKWVWRKQAGILFRSFSIAQSFFMCECWGLVQCRSFCCGPPPQSAKMCMPFPGSPLMWSCVCVSEWVKLAKKHELGDTGHARWLILNLNSSSLLQGRVVSSTPPISHH